MANDLVTRLLLNSTQFDNNLKKSTQEVQDFKKKAEQVGSTFSKGFGMVSKFIPQLALLTGGLTTATAAFDAAKGSSQTFSDGLDKVTTAISALGTAFVSSAIQGSFDSYFRNLGQIKNKAAEVAKVLDDLNSSALFNDPLAKYYKSEAMEYKYAIMNAQTLEEKQELLLKGQKALNKYVSAANNSAKHKIDAARGVLEKSLITQDYEGYRFTGKISDEQLSSIMGISEQDAKDMVDTFSKNIQSELKRIKKPSPFDYKKTSDYAEALKQYEKEKVEFQNYINEHPIEWAFFMALKSNKVEEALGIVRQTQVEVQQTNQDIQGTTKEFNECKSSIEKMNKPLSNTEKTLSKVAEEAKDFREAIGNGTLKVNIYGANGSITNLFDDENLVKAIKSLPDEIAAELSEDIKQFNATQELTNLSLDKGLISDEEWAKKTNENQNNLFNSVYKLAENGYVTQGKIVANESYLPTLQQILLKIGNQNKANATTSTLHTDFAVRRKTSETYGKTLSTLFEMYLENDAIDKSAFNGIADVESKLKGLLDIQSRIKQSNQALNRQIKTIIKEQDLALYESYINLSDYQQGQIVALDSLIAKLREFLKELSNQQAFIEAMDLAASIGNSIADVFDAAGESQAAFFLNATTSIFKLMAEYANLAMVAGVKSAADLPFPYNMAAVATTVATLSAILSSAMHTFANGGIVGGGSYSGDSQMVRVNSGEMILNGSQQANLFRMLNNPMDRTQSNVGQVEFKLRGQELIGLIKNTQSKHNRIL